MKRQFNSRFGVLVPEPPPEASSPLFIGIHKKPTFYPRSERGEPSIKFTVRWDSCFPKYPHRSCDRHSKKQGIRI